MKNLLYLIVLSATLFACKADPDFEEIDLGYDYFPNLSGTYIEYEVDSIHYGATVDTTHFYLREVIADDFVDDEDQRATSVERYKRLSPMDDWVLADVWTQKRTLNTAERVEENERFIRLVFPLEQGKTWNGNSFNLRDEWTYRCATFDAPFALEDVSFSNTCSIQQRSVSNLVDQQIYREVYGRDIGMIYKEYTDLSFQEGAIVGDVVTMQYIDHGYAQ